MKFPDLIFHNDEHKSCNDLYSRLMKVNNQIHKGESWKERGYGDERGLFEEEKVIVKTGTKSLPIF